MYNWFTLLDTWNYHNIVNQLHSNVQKQLNFKKFLSPIFIKKKKHVQWKKIIRFHLSLKFYNGKKKILQWVPLPPDFKSKVLLTASSCWSASCSIAAQLPQDCLPPLWSSIPASFLLSGLSSLSSLYISAWANLTPSNPRAVQIPFPLESILQDSAQCCL